MPNIVNNVKEKGTIVKNAVKDKIDNIDISVLVAKAVHMPGAKIDRPTYLRKELKRYYSEETIQRAISSNPTQAGIPRWSIDKIAKNAIKYETAKVTTISVITGVPGGFASMAAIPADITQYYVFILRILQKLAYLYGYPDFEFSESDLDDATMMKILTFIGVMFGIKEAHIGIKVITEITAKNLPKKLANQALMKTAYYRIIKEIAKKLGVHMTKDAFAESVGKAIPVVGGAVNGVLTFASFRPCAISLKNRLRKNKLSSLSFYGAEDVTKHH